jgi:hypothetical protein
MYIDGVINDGTSDTPTIAVITRRILLVDELKVKMLIGQDIMTPEKMLLDFEHQELRIGSRANINTKTSKDPSIETPVRSRSKTTMPPFRTVDVPIIETFFLDRRISATLDSPVGSSRT